jgi:hypothetical protein
MTCVVSVWSSVDPTCPISTDIFLTFNDGTGITTNDGRDFVLLDEHEDTGGGGGGVPGGDVTVNFPGGLNGQVQINNGGAFGGITVAQLTALIQPFTNSTSGAVPAGYAPSGGGSTSVQTIYTTAGNISLGDTLSIINSPNPITMTLAAPVMTGHEMVVNNYGPGTATIHLVLQGTTQDVALTQGSVLDVVWNSALASYLFVSGSGTGTGGGGGGGITPTDAVLTRNNNQVLTRSGDVVLHR